MQYLLLTGLLALVGQIVLLRELHVAFYGVELVYLLALGAWMVGTAIGSTLWSPRSERPERVLAWLATAAGAAVPLDVAFIRASRVIFGGVPGAFLPFTAQLATMVLGVVPVAALLGLLFQRAARAHISAGRTLASAYGIESVGAVAGGVAATILVRLGTQNLALAAGCALVAGVMVAVRRAGPGLRFAAALLAGGAAIALVSSGPLDRWMTGWNHPALAYSHDSPYGRVTVTRAQGQVSVFENDRLAFESQGTTAEEFVHLAAIQRARAGDVLVLGGTPEGIVGEILKHRPSRVDAVELDRSSFDAIVAGLPEATTAALDSPLVHLQFTDPRRFLRAAGRYDLILIAMGEPESGQSNRFYTREFFEACAARLTADGVLAFRLASAENVWTPLLRGRMISIQRALRAVFPDAVWLPGPTNLVLASGTALSRDPAELSARFLERRLGSRIVNTPFIRYLYTNDRRARIERMLSESRAPMNTDLRPVCYQYAAVLWLAKFFPALGTRDVASALDPTSAGTLAWGWGTALAAVAAVFVAGRRRAPTRRVLLAGTAGMAGMLLETVLLLDFQSRNGILYQDVGLLLTSFMAGLALGAIAFDRLAARSAGTESPRRVQRLGYAVIGATVLLAAIAALHIRSTSSASLAGTSAWLLGGGALVAAAFAYASLAGVSDQERVVSPLYAADLAGGAAGAVLGPLLLIPLAGLVPSLLFAAALAALAMLVV